MDVEFELVEFGWALSFGSGYGCLLKQLWVYQVYDVDGAAVPDARSAAAARSRRSGGGRRPG